MQELSLKGFRVLACAYKPIAEASITGQLSELESEMTFVGFIMFKNQIKGQTTETIEELTRNRVKCIMVTGDNLFTATNVAYQCRILKPNQQIYLCKLSSRNVAEWFRYHYTPQQPSVMNELGKLQSVADRQAFDANDPAS